MWRYQYLLVCILAFGQTGCMLAELGKGIGDALRPRPGNDWSSKDESDEDWGSVGREGRADQPRIKETDGLSGILESPKAREINSSLGID
jgi:hypothetical protein